MSEKWYDWGGKDEEEKINSLYAYLQQCISSSLDAFCSKHSWLLQRSTSPKEIGAEEGSSYYNLFGVWAMNASFCLGKKSGSELDPIYKYDEVYRYSEQFLSFQEEAFKKIIKARGLNSEQAEELKDLAYSRAKSLNNCLSIKEEMRGALYRDGRVDKAFWMETELNNFIKVMKEGINQYIKKGVLFGEIPEAFMKGDGAKKYQGDKGRKRFAKDITDEVFAEFEKDLREVQRDVMTYLEASKHWWEKWWVQWVLIAVAGLSGISSLFTIGVWFIPIGTVIVVVWLVVDIVRMRTKNRRS